MKITKKDLKPGMQIFLTNSINSSVTLSKECSDDYDDSYWTVSCRSEINGRILEKFLDYTTVIVERINSGVWKIKEKEKEIPQRRIKEGNKYYIPEMDDWIYLKTYTAAKSGWNGWGYHSYRISPSTLYYISMEKILENLKSGYWIPEENVIKDKTNNNTHDIKKGNKYYIAKKRKASSKNNGAVFVATTLLVDDESPKEPECKKRIFVTEVRIPKDQLPTLAIYDEIGRSRKLKEYGKWQDHLVSKLVATEIKRILRTTKEAPICPHHGPMTLVSNYWKIAWICEKEEKE